MWTHYSFNDVTDSVNCSLWSLYTTTFLGQRRACFVECDIYDLCCSKMLLLWTDFELHDDRMSHHEFYGHSASSRNIFRDSSHHELEEARVGPTKSSFDSISDLSKNAGVSNLMCVFVCVRVGGWVGCRNLIKLSWCVLAFL